MTRRTGVVMPVRAFRTAHTRLADQLDPSQRSDLARRLAERVVAAARTLPVVVVTSAPEVRDWAAEHGVDTIDDPGSLDAAAAVGRAWHREHGCTRIIVAHADLPRARSLAPLARDGARPIVAIVPCHRDDGTPVMSLPTDLDFDLHYGAGSFRLHVAEARRRGLGVRVIRDPDLGFDIDTPEDLERLDEEPAR